MQNNIKPIYYLTMGMLLVPVVFCIMTGKLACALIAWAMDIPIVIEQYIQTFFKEI